MSTGTNKERIEQNNTLLEDIKTQIQNLPEAGGSGDVKQFATVEEMNNSTGNKEGDLAVVYRSEVKNAIADSRFQTATFPDTVVLDTAITDYVEVRYRAVDSSKMFDCMGSLDSSSFRMDCYSESGEVRIEYTSSDGITYTRTDTTGNPVDFGTEIYYEMTEMWNDAIGKFIQIGGSTFEGLYIYDSTLVNKTTSSYYKVNDIENKGANITIVGYVDVKRLYDFIISHKDQLSDYVTNFAGMAGVLLINNDGTYTLYSSVASSSNAILSDMVPSIVNNVHGLLDIKYQYDINKVLKIDIDYGNNNITVTDMSSQLVKYSYTDTASGGKWYLAYLPLEYYGLNMCNMDVSINSNTYKTYITCRKSSYTTGSISTEYLYTIEGTFLPTPMYTIAPTQLTASDDYVYGKEFYGQNGVEIGTLQNKENLTINEVIRRIDIWTNYNTGVICPEDMTSAFSGKSYTTIPLLDTSKVTNTSYMFRYCSNLTTIPELNTSKVTYMNWMFHDCTKLTSIPLLDTSSVTSMFDMFNGCINLTTIPLLDTSSVTNMSYMFYGCINLTTIPLLDTSSVTNMSYMFYGCTSLTTIPLLDTSSVTNMKYMFQDCTNLTEIPQLDTSSVTDTYYMFKDCTSLTSIPLLDTSSVTNMSYMFGGCTNLTTIPLLDTSNVTNMTDMFCNCTNLTTIPLLDTSNVTGTVNMFNGCTNLATIPELNTSNVTNMRAMFNRCTSLSDESLNNILAMCANTTSHKNTKTLKYLGLTSEQATKCQSLSNYSAFTAAGWTTGY